MPRIEYIPQVMPDGTVVLRAIAPTARERLRDLLRRLRRPPRR